MSERRKIRKVSQFINEITYKYVIKNKKRAQNESSIESDGGESSSRKKYNQSPDSPKKQQDANNTS